MTQYATLRTWAFVLTVMGVLGMFVAGFGAIVWAFEVEGFWQTLGVLLIGLPVAIFLATLPIATSGVLASFYVGRNTIWVIAKDMPRSLVRRHFGRIVRSQWRIAWQAARTWRGAAARARLRGQLAGLAGLPKVMGWRRATQPSCTVSFNALDRLLLRD